MDAKLSPRSGVASWQGRALTEHRALTRRLPGCQAGAGAAGVAREGQMDTARSLGWGGGRPTNGIGGREGRKCGDPLEASRGLELERTEGPWHLDLFVVVNLLEAKV